VSCVFAGCYSVVARIDGKKTVYGTIRAVLFAERLVSIQPTAAEATDCQPGVSLQTPGKGESDPLPN
jgi:hypothetical protein